MRVPEPWHVLHASGPPGSAWHVVHAVAPGAERVTPGTEAGDPAWHWPHALGSAGSSIGDHRWLRRSAPWNALDLGSTMPGGWTVPANAGAPAATQAASVAWSPSLKSPGCGAVPSAARIGAVDGGNVAGAPEGSMHAIVERNDVTDHPAAGDVAPWHETQ